MAEVKRAIVKSYDAVAHKAAVQIAGSLAVWLDDVRVATNIPPADVVSGRQCTVLFLDPSNQDEAVIIAIQGSLPSVGEILIATATADLTLTQTAQSITGDGDSSKVRLLLPTPGDWLIEAVVDFIIDVDNPGTLKGELFVNDSGTGEPGLVLFKAVATEAGTKPQQWKVTTTIADTPIELKAYKDNAGGTARALATHTRLTATGVKRSTGGAGVSDHGALTGLGDPDHSAYGPLASANAWAALQTFNAGLRLAAGQVIEDSGGNARIALATTNPHVSLGGTGGVRIDGTLGIDTLPSLLTSPKTMLKVIPADFAGSINGADFQVTATGTGAQGGTGLQGVGTTKATGSAPNATGLSFISQLFAAGAFSRNRGMIIKHNYILQANSVIEGFGVRVDTPSVAAVSATITDSLGVVISDQKIVGATVTRQTGLHITDQTGGVTNYLIFAGALITGTPRLRLDAGTPGANQTMLHLAEGVTPTVRRVQWKAGNVLVAGDKVMVLV